MPTLDKHQSTRTTKLLIEGDSGTGKTGSLISLILDGYKLYVLDFDNGMDIIINLLRKHKRTDLFANVDVHTLTDKMSSAGVHLVPAEATAWARMVELLGNWPGVGNVRSLGEKDILVLDSLNFAGRAAMRYVAKLNGRLTAPPQIQDYFDAQRMIENLCATLYDTEIKCNVIVMTHLKEIYETRDVVNAKGNVVQVKVEGSGKMLPETGAGKAMSPVIGRFFNGVVMADMVGSGSGLRRILRTVPHEKVGLKTPAPGMMPNELPLDTGLSTYFATVRGEVPAVGVSTASAAQAAIEAALPRR